MNADLAKILILIAFVILPGALYTACELARRVITRIFKNQGL